MAIKKITDMIDLVGLAPGAGINRTVTMTGLPRGKRAANLWVYMALAFTRGVGGVVHQPQAISQIISQIEASIGRHVASITDGQDLYSAQEILRGSILGHNASLGSAQDTYILKYPIPMHYLFGGLGEWATRPPTEELEGQTINFIFANPFGGGDVDVLGTTQLSLYLEYYERGEEAVPVGEGLEELAQWGTILVSRAGNSGNIYHLTDIIPSIVLLKDRSWTNMTVKANGKILDEQLTPDQFILQDGDRWNRFPPDPLLGYTLDATEINSIRMLNAIPTASGEPQNWTKLLDLRNDRDAQGPYEFQANAGYSFADRGIVIIGRRAVAGTPMVQT